MKENLETSVPSQQEQDAIEREAEKRINEEIKKTQASIYKDRTMSEAEMDTLKRTKQAEADAKLNQVITEQIESDVRRAHRLPNEHEES